MSLVLPYPSCPKDASPQQRTVPVESSAQVWRPPTAIWVAVIPAPRSTSPTAEGDSSSPMLFVLPYPSCPECARPQQRTVPVDSSAQVWDAAVAIWGAVLPAPRSTSATTEGGSSSPMSLVLPYP